MWMTTIHPSTPHHTVLIFLKLTTASVPWGLQWSLCVFCDIQNTISTLYVIIFVYKWSKNTYHISYSVSQKSFNGASSLHFCTRESSQGLSYARATRKLHAHTRRSHAHASWYFVLARTRKYMLATLMLALATRTLSLARFRSLDLLASALVLAR